MNNLMPLIEHYYNNRNNLTQYTENHELKSCLEQVLKGLNEGKLRVAEYKDNCWQTNEWLKKAILLCFQFYKNEIYPGSFSQFYDKIPPKFLDHSANDFKSLAIRVVPPTYVRYGAYVAKGTVLMPCFVNIGAYIGENSMIDAWATVGSCAQIGSHVHISGGAGIGGVLEPLQSQPTIIEDHCFIGARSEIVEGVVVEKGSVISMGVFIGQSTKIYNRMTGEITQGRIPAGSVVVPGSIPSKDGRYHLQAAIIVKQVDSSTKNKIQLNEILHSLDE